MFAGNVGRGSWETDRAVGAETNVDNGSEERQD
jgi:hypothetical protein